MQIAKLTCLIIFGLSALTATAAESDTENNNQCVYQGQSYGIGSPINIDGHSYICVKKANKMMWLPAIDAQRYL
ncbi:MULTISPECIES: DUF1496 domain-containing protein [Enterobacterales]|uniref:DUF1496 domain-containing protein n=2 Tax=Morganellaceae TaxID=1903414 RepID=A0AAE4FII8_MORMO|nr:MULTISPECIES: DUF1496 domain-containing protein [Enterobacterales]EAP4395424.1 DUF1496 domain-containing protein [Salmonella enterica]ECM0800562.1 DUF1496 domain-containing protein [Salmonella enterica subsp. enterica serovar Enteritidis]EDR5596953.1 DUF1496 domain-containing protein [Salmonella enterica subsp. diarizonae]EFP7242565.1 DUF1496 domain-containing protein [Shigella flexneri]EJR0218714.1 DUF1496 domain-containing protein [Klebsiella pneumoniae]EKO1087539.1 DUF1496 domain-contai